MLVWAKLVSCSSRSITVIAFSSLLKPIEGLATSLATIRSRFLSFSLRAAYCRRFSVSAAKPTLNGRSLRCARVARMSGLRTSCSSRPSPVVGSFFSFCSATTSGR
ncbi:hypothetical protein D9M68_854950 [compost metagenome]